LRIRHFLTVFAALAAGCNTESPAREGQATPQPPANLGTAFDAAKTGTVAGRVTWNGAIPDVPEFLCCVPQKEGHGLDFVKVDNPNRPRIDAKTHAVAGAVVFLRGVDPTASRPWDLPTVRVEMAQGAIVVVQGDRRDRVGFVHRGDGFTTLSAEASFHVLRGRGDAFFSLTLPEPGHPVARTLTNPGRVELSSGSGQYWARADLFVADHPYYAVTDAAGRFNFTHVPAGPVEVVAWLPGWNVARQDRDVDTTAIVRMTYTPPVERTANLIVTPGTTVEAPLSVP